ncbi:flagellar hook-basal body complex protein [Polynucleobacter sp. JS-Mosq-20-D10]|uniref:flagellar hook-basal body complex protein n=1 Tax=Polynucleobacter sp. JS-Mosq-20-D10 TaxID=2576922 RepID=UPI001BFD6A23|nr:flagellar hook-basal body complex protein [Polynucleobacter sp. JS-Mosq-20-D10]QWE00911.1 flagellar hook-basal body complex protein [Polynucleobacter sp. JS-Mosq-20-D10]
MGYGIGLAGLASTAEAIDVTSNNIANAQTVGYKSGEYVFADMYFKAADAQAKDRVGMGSFRQSIRRSSSYGTIVNSQNVLDMAIAGPGMFMLAKEVNDTVPIETPSNFQYTRNGQFGTDSKNRICNENGLLLCGYPADETGRIVAGATTTLKLDQTPLKQEPTRESKIELNLDNRNLTIGNKKFDPTNSTTFSQATSQTVYDQNGNEHILGMYYKKVQSLPLTLEQDNTGAFTYTASEKVATDQAVKDAIGDPDGKLADYEQANQIGRISTTINGINKKLEATANSAAALTAYNALSDDEKGKQVIRGAEIYKTSSGPAAVGSIYDFRFPDGTHMSLRMTQVADPAAVPPKLAQYTVMADRYAVFATMDGKPIGHDPKEDTDDYLGTATQIKVDSVFVKEQVCIGTMAFIGGKNVDTIEKNYDGTPVNNNETRFKLLANGGVAPTVLYGLNNSPDGNGVLDFTVKSNTTTALNAATQTYANTQDGHAVSSVTGFSIDTSGQLLATYANGQTAVKGQLILAYFNNPEGLMPNGNNSFGQTDKSGPVITGFAGNGMMGQIRSKSLESSNVDLTNELVKLMVLQRQYSAMSQATKTMAASIIDDTINIGR